MKNKGKILIMVLIVAFILLSICVTFELTLNFDNAIYEFLTFNINNLMTNFYKAITFLGSTGFIVFLCIFFLILFIFLKKKNYGIIISCVLIVSTLVNNLLKIIFCRERPNVLKLVVEDSYSFPSGHTMAAVSMYGILMYLILKSNINKKLKIMLSILLCIIPFMVAISRVYLGAHYITDIIGAYLMSIILLLIEIYIIDKKKLL